MYRNFLIPEHASQINLVKIVVLFPSDYAFISIFLKIQCFTFLFFFLTMYPQYKTLQITYAFLCHSKKSHKTMAITTTLPNSKTLKLSLITLIFVSQLAIALSSGTIFERAKAHVYVTNTLGTGDDLTVHCKSRDDDLGVQVIKPGKFYTFTFRPNYFGGTLFFCGMSWRGNFHRFDIYNENRDVDKCNACCWNIKPSGPCRCNCNNLLPCGNENCLPWD